MGSNIPRAVLLLAWLFAVVGIVGISSYNSGESTHFFGIADDQEQTIRFTSPVEIVNYGFVAGQKVTAGDLTVEVRKPELDSELQIIQEKIQALKFGNRESRASMESEIVQLKADLRANLSELDSQIRNLQARQSAAQSLLGELQGDSQTSRRSPVQQEIDSLRVRKQSLQRATTARLNDLNSRLATSERPVDAQIAELENRWQDVVRQRAELSVFAQLDGRVGSVLFKVGETVPPYQPVLTVHGSRPSFIKGYIHENVLNDVGIGQTVWIRSTNSTRDNVWNEGVVEGLGSRIVEFPNRLKVNPLVQAWGREVVIRLDDQHALLLGEKVNVQLEQPMLRFSAVRNALAKESP